MPYLTSIIIIIITNICNTVEEDTNFFDKGKTAENYNKLLLFSSALYKMHNNVTKALT